MASSSIDSIPGRFEVKATASDHFAWLRTRLSIERTMMSWVRTAAALPLILAELESRGLKTASLRR